mmetsp:Transcript_46916/g.124106  ORF Transcript_46916/g.124106 Transcript_46916/m.124106 type:complete len:629 (+) Transcript_46916:39-1925(+)
MTAAAAASSPPCSSRKPSRASPMASTAETTPTSTPDPGAVPLIRHDSEGKMVLLPEGLRELRQCEGPVLLVCALGASRAGKSTLGNALVGQQAFRTGDSWEAVTAGVDISAVPTTGGTLVFADFEGSYNPTASSRNAFGFGRLGVLAHAVAGLVVHVGMGALDERDLESLAWCSEQSRRLLGPRSEQGAPELVVVVNNTRFQYGDKFLEENLFTGECDDDARGAIRDALREGYRSIPRLVALPSLDSAGYEGALSTLEDLVAAAPPRLSGDASGEQVAEYLEAIVGVIESDTPIDREAAVEGIARQELQVVADQAWEEYCEGLRHLEGTGLSNDPIDEVEARIRSRAADTRASAGLVDKQVLALRARAQDKWKATQGTFASAPRNPAAALAAAVEAVEARWKQHEEAVSQLAQEVERGLARARTPAVGVGPAWYGGDVAQLQQRVQLQTASWAMARGTREKTLEAKLTDHTAEAERIRHSAYLSARSLDDRLGHLRTAVNGFAAALSDEREHLGEAGERVEQELLGRVGDVRREVMRHKDQRLTAESEWKCRLSTITDTCATAVAELREERRAAHHSLRQVISQAASALSRAYRPPGSSPTGSWIASPGWGSVASAAPSPALSGAETA